MSNMTYRDIPTLRSAGFKSGQFGSSWFGVDKHGKEWQVTTDDDDQLLIFISPERLSMRLSREKFDTLFT